MVSSASKLEQGVLEEVVSQVLPHPVPQPQLVSVQLSWVLSRGGPPLLLPLQLVVLLPDIIHVLCILHLVPMEVLPLDLTDVMQQKGCDSDLGEVVLSELESDNEGVLVALEAGEGTLHQGAGLAQAVVSYEPRQKQVGRVPSGEGRNSPGILL